VHHSLTLGVPLVRVHHPSRWAGPPIGRLGQSASSASQPASLGRMTATGRLGPMAGRDAAAAYRPGSAPARVVPASGWNRRAAVPGPAPAEPARTSSR